MANKGTLTSKRRKKTTPFGADWDPKYTEDGQRKVYLPASEQGKMSAVAKQTIRYGLYDKDRAGNKMTKGAIRAAYKKNLQNNNQFSKKYRKTK